LHSRQIRKPDRWRLQYRFLRRLPCGHLLEQCRVKQQLDVYPVRCRALLRKCGRVDQLDVHALLRWEVFFAGSGQCLHILRCWSVLGRDWSNQQRDVLAGKLMAFMETKSCLQLSSMASIQMTNFALWLPLSICRAPVPSGYLQQRDRRIKFDCLYQMYRRHLHRVWWQHQWSVRSVRGRFIFRGARCQL
jgi:hypothetical protein